MSPSTLPEDTGTPSHRLQVETESPSAEIFLVDHRLQLIDRGIGRLETRRPAGVYKVKIREGRETYEEMVLLEKDRTVRRRVQFASPAPLGGTTQTHEYHMGGAERHSKQIDKRVGKGATIFVLARYWTSKSADPSRLPSPHPAAGLSLSTFDGRWTVDVADLAPAQRNGDPWAAATIEVDPGAYVFRATTEGGVTEQTIVATPRWQTQVFLLNDVRPRRRSSRQEVRALTSNETDLSVLMSKESFESQDPNLRLAEVARIALADERPVLSQQLEQLLLQKFDNPMHGLFGAHLMLLARERSTAEAVVRAKRPHDSTASRPPRPGVPFDQDLFDVVVKNLRGLLGAHHPDVEALALACGDRSLHPKEPIRVPPMLRRSWSLLVSASSSRPWLVPHEVWQRAAMPLPVPPFLRWANDPNRYAEYVDRLREALRARQTEEKTRGDESEPQAFSYIRNMQTMSGPEEFRDEGLVQRATTDLEVPRAAIEVIMT